MAKKGEVYILAPSCPNGEHKLIDADPPWYAQCVHCKMRFALISEAAINRLGITPVERTLTKQ